MAESELHRNLVNIMYRWISRVWFDGDDAAVFVDDGKTSTGPAPPAILGHRPDVYAQSPGLTGVIVGEAKTPGDLESPRSQKQLSAYLSYCAGLPDSRLVVAVPWTHETSARALLRTIKKSNGTEDVQTNVMSHLDALSCLQ